MSIDLLDRTGSRQDWPPTNEDAPADGHGPETTTWPLDQARADRFLGGLASRCLLGREETAQLRDDFRAALLYYRSTGLPLTEALARLDMKNLGGFYAHPAQTWYKIDDAAKIYPLSMRHGQMKMFRLSVRFTTDVVPELLQMALTFTIKRFPTFATTVKRGFFWHYLDAAKRRYAIQPESDMPCRPLPVSRSASQSFRVLYFRNRVSVEFFHILTDGLGGIEFIRSLTAEYLRLLGVTTPSGTDIMEAGGLPTASEAADEIAHIDIDQDADDSDEAPAAFFDRPAVQMSGKLKRSIPCRVLHFAMDASALKEAAKARHTTVTAYVLALMFVASHYATDKFQGDISIQVPVNLRQYYPSDTLRNFQTYCAIRLPLHAIISVDAIIDEISRQLKQKTSKPAMRAMLGTGRRIVAWTRWIPLPIKASVARAVYSFLDEALFTTTLSNLGVVHLPPELAAHVDSLDCVLGPSLVHRASCALVTFGQVAMLSITKMTVDPSFEERLYDLLVADGVPVHVEGTESDGR